MPRPLHEHWKKTSLAETHGIKRKGGGCGISEPFSVAWGPQTGQCSKYLGQVERRGAGNVRFSELGYTSKNDPKWHDPVTVQDTHVFILLLPSGSWAETRIQDVQGSFSNSLVPCGRETQWPPLVFTSMQLGWSAPPAGCQKGTSNELCFWPLTEGEVSVKYQLLERISEGLTFFSHENEDPHGTMCWHSGDTYNSMPNQSRSCCCRFVMKESLPTIHGILN